MTTKSGALPIRQVGPEAGLVGSKIIDFAQDAQGYMWLITNKALHRFDGYSMKVFQHNPDDPKSNPHTDFHTLFADNNNHLWLASISGILKFDIAKQEFHVMAEFELSRKPVFKQDKQGNVWYLNDYHVHYFEQDSQLMRKIDLYQSFLSHGFERPLITTFDMISDDQILIVRYEDDCALYHIDEKKITNDLPLVLKKVCHNAKYLQAIGRHLYIRGADDRLYRYDTELQTTTPLLSFGANELTSALLHDQQNNIWIANLGSLYKIHANSSNVIQYTPYNVAHQTLNDFEISQLFEDRNGHIWIATRGSGQIAIYDPEVETFLFDEKEYKDNINFIGKSIHTLFNDSRKRLWVAMDQEVYAIDLVSKTKQSIPLFDEQGNLLQMGIFSDIVESSDGTLWFATSRGLYQYNEYSRRFVQRFPNAHDPQQLAQIPVIALDIDAQDRMWLGTVSHGLFRFDPATNKSQQYLRSKDNVGSLLDDIVVEVKVDRQQRVWAATVLGLSRLDSPDSNDFTHYKASQKNKHSLCGRIINEIFQDSQSNLWFATDNGLGRFNEKQQDFNCYSERNGLASSNTLSITEDANKHHFWVATMRGLSVVNSEGVLIQNYGEKEGLFSRMPMRASTMDQDGVLWLGTIDGLNRLHPQHIHGSPVTPNLVLTALNVNHQPWSSAENLNTLEHLQLDYYQNTLQFVFSQLDYNRPERQRYKIKLDNWDKQWTQLGTANQFQYNNLPPGDYRFHIALANDYSANDEAQKTLSVTINPPLWQTTQAYVLYVLLALLLIYVIVTLRTRRLKTQAAHLEQLVEERLEEIIDQKKTIEHLLAKKDELFANVSHEFRTPLTLILGPLTQLHDESRYKGIKTVVGPVLNNAKRLLRMVDQLLDMARLESAPNQPSSPVAINPLITNMTNQFDSLLQQHQLELTLRLTDNAEALLPLDALEKILINLFSNAVKYTSNGGHIQILTEWDEATQLLCIQFIDNGIGIAPEHQAKIFERFVRLEQQESTPKIPGAGIGLALVKQMVEYYGGRIELSSTIGKGSCFSVYLPGHINKRSAGITETTTQQATQQEVDSLMPQTTAVLQQNEGQEKSPAQDVTVLIVEDHADMQQYIIQALSPYFNCIYANNGEEGIAKAMQEVPDLIITDLMMPKKDGFEFSKVIRNDTRTSHIPIIMLTASSEPSTRLQAWQSEIDEFFNKPFSAKELVTRCQNLLNIRRILSQRLSKSITNNNTNKIEALNERDHAFLDKLKTLVQDNYTDPELSAKFLSKSLAMSDSQLQRKIKALLNQSVPDYIRTYRLQQASHQLKQNQLISEIAYSVGFSNPTYFSSCFKAYFGMTPKAWQQQKTKQEIAPASETQGE
ncbi:two-component regulator propeller domain-containing protein [Pleionea sp. CnH1-48]|uniref:hybrid sensor histidine kinase/response regulator transcription factor n=1 Tax=Pleionea sp. CnH1-48 TaxID=2954494 RepID=UPI002097D1B0|nr:two-component regulator propeller domain-containing protein [Pleionea sp. CnH1-48]MCO7223575.1 ATP-binding protein [Pleionea sp. CnH1-48]